MRIVVFDSTKGRESQIVRSFAAGVNTMGDEAIVVTSGDSVVPDGVDAGLVFGVKSRKTWSRLGDLGIRRIYGDKGYSRDSGGWKWLRLSVDDNNNADYVAQAEHTDDSRYKKQGLHVKPWRENGDHILFCGSSEKCMNWYGLPNPTVYAESIFEELRSYTQRPITYRPKPSWGFATPIKGTRYSGPKEPLDVAMDNAWCVVTHGSNTCLDAVLAGVPPIVLGNGITRSISSTELAEVENPEIPTDADRTQLVQNISFCQWTLDEFSDGTAWRYVRQRLT